MVTGVETKLYALSRNESYESSRSFMERRQVSKLPHLTCEELIIDIKGEIHEYIYNIFYRTNNRWLIRYNLNVYITSK